MAQIKEYNMDEEMKGLAICQMHTIRTVLSGGGMDIETAIQQLSLDNEECLQLARDEGLDWIAEEIEKQI